MELMEDGNLMDKVNVLIQRDMEYYKGKHCILLEKVCTGTIGGRLDFPPSSSFAAMKLVIWWEEEYLAAFRKNSGFVKPSNENFESSVEFGGGCGGIVKTSDPDKFVSAITRSSEQILNHLHVLTQEALDHADLSVLNGTIGAASLLKNCLWCYTQNLKSNYAEQLQGILKNYQEMCEALAERLLDLHCRLLSLYILQDAECLDWENEKPFFESERGSYILQMWWLYMRGTRDGLWNTIPPKMAQRVFAGMLNETLTILTVRYGQIVPSEARSKLYAVDISNLLLCIAQLLPSICNDSEELLGLCLNNQSKILRDVHVKSQELLSFFILRTSPLDSLIKLFRKGLDSLEITRSKSNSLSPWIIFALPNIFRETASRNVSEIKDLDDKLAIALELNVLLAQPQPNWSLLLKVLCMRKCMIASWILEESSTRFDRNNFQKIQTTENKCDKFLCCGDGVCKETTKLPKLSSENYFEIISSVAHLFISIGNRSDLINVFLPIIGKGDSWAQCFDRREIWNQNRPAWYEALIEVIKQILPPVTKTVVNAVHTGASMYQAMSIVLACFSQLWDCSDSNVTLICNLFQDNLPLDVVPIGNSALLQLLLSGLYTELINLANNEEKKVKFKQETPSDSMQHKNSLTSFDGTNSSEDAIALAIAEALCSIDEDNKHTEQIVEVLEQISRELEEDFVDHDGCRRVEDTQQTLELLASDLLVSIYGKRTLKILYNFIRNNSEWLYQKLGVSENLDAVEPDKSKCIFDPLLHTMFHIGYRPFDQLLSGSWKPNWNILLRTPMGLTVERIWSHLSYRWEFKDRNFCNLSNSDAQTGKHCILLEKVCTGTIGGRLDFPPSSSFAAMKLVIWWEEEYLAAFRKNSGFVKPSNENFESSVEFGGGCGGIVKTSDPDKFVSAITRSSEQILNHLHVLTQEALDHADLSVLNGTIGAASLLKNCLWCYTQNLKSNYAEQLQGILKNYQEMCEALAERLLDLHCRLLSLYILQDAECLDWENEKPFFESERGSYILQMWWLYMRGTRDELWNTIPPKMAQRVFAGMLNETLTILTVRYGQIVPSEARSKLYAVDISNLLLCIAQLLPSICNDSEELLGLCLNNQSKILRDVHVKSQELLSFFILRISPLDSLIKLFRKGLDSLEITRSRSNSLSPWIIFALPNIFRETASRNVSEIKDLDDKLAIALELNVLLAQPQPNWSLLLKVLCMRKCMIASWILEESSTRFDRNNFQKIQTTANKCDKFLCCGDGVCKETTKSSKLSSENYFEIISSVAHLFISIGNRSDLVNVFLPIIGKGDSWAQCFDRREIWNQNRPAWYEALIEVIKQILPPVTKTVVNAVHTGASMYQAMSIVLACFSQLWDCSDSNVTLICNLFQDNLPLDVIPIGNSALLQLLLSGLYTELINLANNEEKKVKFKQETPSGSMQHKNSLTSFDGTNNSEDAIALAIAEALCSIDEDNKHTEQIVEVLEQISRELEEDFVDHDGCRRVEDTQQTLELLASDLLVSIYGKRTLKILYTFIRNNSEWLYQKLGVSENLDAVEPDKSKCIFDPLLHTMFHIGHRPFDQLLSGSWKPNWNILLRTPMGLTVERIWSHLSYRWEFKDRNFCNLSNSEAQTVGTLTAMLKQNT